MKMVFEIEADVPDGEPISIVSLNVSREGLKWEPVLTAALGKPQRVREGKHLRIDKDKTTVIKVEDKQ